MTLHLAHLVFVGMWAGLILAEFVVELLPRRAPELWPAAIRFHFWMDLLIEVPILLAVAATGALMFWRLQISPTVPTIQMDRTLVLKVAAGLIAVLSNAVCVVLVVVRKKAGGDPARTLRLTNWIAVTPVVGVPCAVVALILGLQRLG